MHHLIIGALEEGGVDRREGSHAFCGKARSEGHRVLLGNADVEGAGRVRLCELVHAGARRHGGGDGADPIIGVRQLRQCLAEHVLIGRGAGRALALLAGDDVELGNAVILVGGVFGGRVALALLGHDMDQYRTFRGVAHVLEHGEQVVEIVPVDRAYVIEAQFLEQGPTSYEAAGEFLGLAEGAVHPAAHLLDDPGGEAADAEIFAGGDHTRQIGRKPANGRCDRHVVVVEDDDQAIARLSRIVHRLIGHASAHRAIANHGNSAPGLALQLVGDSKAQRRGDRGRGVRCAEGIVFALRTLGEARQAPALTHGADAVTPTGDDFVRIALVPNVPNQLVLRRVEDVVNRDGQLHHAEARSKVSARGADSVDHFGAQFVGELAKLAGLEAAQVVGTANLIEQRRVRRLCHNFHPYTRNSDVSMKA